MVTINLGHLFPPCRRLRQLTEVNEPFGGIAVIVAGDFFQLPPVDKSHTIYLRALEGPRPVPAVRKNGGSCPGTPSLTFLPSPSPSLLCRRPRITRRGAALRVTIVVSLCFRPSGGTSSRSRYAASTPSLQTSIAVFG